MKKLVMCMLAVFMTASNLAAQDTMTVRSLRIVDVCSSERRWLIAPTLGRITSRDSLMSFDITIGYDSSITHPIDLLTEGTLSANLDFKPTMNLVVKGEMRIAGFNIITPMVGDKPVFAVAGNFAGNCADLDTLSIPWPPSFNSEFKRLVTVFKNEPIISIAAAKMRNDVGMWIEEDSVIILGNDSVGMVAFDVRLPGLSNISAIATINNSDTSKAIVTLIEMTGATILSTERSNGELHVAFKQSGNAQPRIEATFRNVTTSLNEKVLITSKLSIQDSCTCVWPKLTDSVVIKTENPTVRVSSSADERNNNLLIIDQIARCYCDHGQTNSINVFNAMGQLVGSTSDQLTNETFLSMHGLPHGLYFVVSRCGKKRTVTMEMK